MKKGFSSLILIFMVLIGLSLLLYPTVSNCWNQFHQSKLIVTYVEEVAGVDASVKEKLWSEALNYNAGILKRDNQYVPVEGELQKYYELLNVDGSGVMGYIEIPKINCYLPIYHGTQESILQIAVGHIEWTSLPVGGESTHCVLSGHRGLPSARLFTDLDKLDEGDVFTLRVLDEVLAYEVDQILVVEPDELDALQIVEGEDYCTLVTCTPYGINSHRLLVRGHRVETSEEAGNVRLTSEAVQIEPMLVAPVVACPMVCIFIVWFIISGNKRKKSSR